MHEHHRQNIEQAARAAAREDARDWVRTAEGDPDALRALIEGIEAGDPATLDTFPSAQHGVEVEPETLADLAGVGADEFIVPMAEHFRTTYIDAEHDEVDRQARALLAECDARAYVEVDGDSVADIDDGLPGTTVRLVLDEDGYQDGQRFAWINAAGIELKTGHQSTEITLFVSLGDPRGAFAMTIVQVDEDATDPTTGERHEHAGRQFMHLPHPTDGMLHLPLVERSPGHYAIGE